MALDEPRRVHRRRASGAHLFVLLAGLCGLVLTLTILRDHTSARQRIAVAAHDLQSGEVLRSSDVRFDSVSADDRVLERLVPGRKIASLRGRVITVSMRSGDPFLASHLRSAAAPDGRRAMSIPIDRSAAVDGDLAPGDRVDVVVAGNDAVEVVAAGIEVLAVDDPAGGAFGSGRAEITVTLAVDTVESQRLTRALADGGFVMTRVTGAESATGTAPLTTGARSR